MWLKRFKIALVLEETEKLSSLLDEMPHFEHLDQMEEAAYLLEQCKTLMQSKKLETAKTLQQIKNGLSFLESAQHPPPHSLNLKF